jgi:photosystem II stability/assembly factor-like uncharacterized protein
LLSSVVSERDAGVAPLSRALAPFTLLALALASSAVAQIPVLDEPRVPRHWSDLAGELPSEPFTAVAVDPRDADNLFAGNDGFVFKSDDGGETWRPVLSFPRGLSVDVELALEDPAFAFGRADDPAAESIVLEIEEFDVTADDDDDDDDDDSDQNSQNPPDFSDEVAFDVTALPPATGGDDGLPTGDADLRRRYGREEPGVRAIRFAPGTKAAIWVATPRGLFRSTDGGEVFTQVDLPGGAVANDVRDLAIDPGDAGTLFAATAAGLLITRDGGATFTRGPDDTGHLPALSLAAARSGGLRVVVLGTATRALRSIDGGATFRALLLKGESAFTGVAVVAFDPRDQTTYAGTSAGLFAGERSAAILERRASLSGERVLAASIDPRRVRGIAVGMAGRGVRQSNDTGITLLQLPDQLPAETVADIARPTKESDALIVATERGIFRFDEGTGISVATDRLRDLRKIWSREPTLAETARAAVAWARVSPASYDDMVGRMRIAKLAPRLTLDFRWAFGRSAGLEFGDITNDEYILETDPEELEFLRGGDAALLMPGRATDWTLMATATWDVDQLVFRSEELTASRELSRQSVQERRILDRVRALFNARRRAMMQIYLDEPGPPLQRTRQILRLAELTSLLAAVTGGRFIDDARNNGAELSELDAATGALFNLEAK